MSMFTFIGQNVEIMIVYHHRYIVSKWKHDIDRNCLNCNGIIIENNEHLIYSCSNVDLFMFKCR